MRWSGKTAEGEDVAGRLIIPEVSHEVTVDGLSDYVVCLTAIRRLELSLMTFGI